MSYISHIPVLWQNIYFGKRARSRLILKFGNLNAQHHNIIIIICWYVCVKFKLVIFFISWLFKCYTRVMLKTRTLLCM